MVGAATLGMSLSLPVYLSYFFGLFVRPLGDEFGWGRGDIALAVTISSLTMMVASPLFGRLVDRRGARAAILPAIIATALTVVLGAFNPGSLAFFYAVHVAVALAGMGTLPLCYTRIVVEWFEARRGLALGIALAGIGLGGALFPLIVREVIAMHGWRWGYVAIAALMLGLALPGVTRWLREKTTDRRPNAASIPALGVSLGEAVGTRSFWLLSVAMLFMGAVTVGVAVHLTPLLGDHGLTGAYAAAGVSAFGLAVVFGRIAAGFLIDRFSARIVAGAVISASAIGLAVLATADAPAMLFVGIGLVGIGIGAEFDFLSFFVARLMGLRHYGAIYGVIYSVFMLGCATGPALLGFLFDLQGTYRFALFALACGTAISAAAFFGLGRDRQLSNKLAASAAFAS